MELKIEVNVKGFDKLAEAILALANGKLIDPAEISDVDAVEVVEVKEPKKAKAEAKKVEAKKEAEKTPLEEMIGREVKIDMDYLKSLCLGLSKKNKGTAVKGILTEMGLTKASEVTEDKYPQLIKALEELNND